MITRGQIDAAQQVKAALEAGANELGILDYWEVTVEAIPDLSGARIVACCREVFVVTKDAGYSVECWRKWEDEAHKIIEVPAVTDAVHLALTEI